MKQICKLCGTPFEARSLRQKYCSEKCIMFIRRLQGRKSRKKEREKAPQAARVEAVLTTRPIFWQHLSAQEFERKASVLLEHVFRTGEMPYHTEKRERRPT